MTPYQRVMLFSGGSTRFGYYLGSYAALCEFGLPPDLILASCGGSLAALLVDIAPNPKDLRDLSQSQVLYQALGKTQPTHAKNSFGLTNHRHLYQALKRYYLDKSYLNQSYLNKKPKKLARYHHTDCMESLLDELKNQALFTIDDDWLEPLLNLKADLTTENTTSSPDIAIIASRFYQPNNENRATKQLDKQTPDFYLQEVLFAPKAFANHPLLTAMSCPLHQVAPNRIAKSIYPVFDWQWRHAIRASIADMYYLSPIYIDGVGWSLGGVIDLTPIEMAVKLGKTVFAETKADYDTKLAVPAIKRVFGFDPNQRWQRVYQEFGDSSKHNVHWLPFADQAAALNGNYIGKKFRPLLGKVELNYPSYDKFVQQMAMQWQFGYQRTADYLKSLL
ncbi:patatin-like phospholipase family protein [Psychrobacter ciconiae]|uniref:patatin-like phospholipase family protein n=1 Tax=Psychrobacter ciconiae TaxID=1553449 RepID=UPI00191B31EF|nr:patatin-like phospholipase family protein [Psychrobacter ciconiae]